MQIEKSSNGPGRQQQQLLMAFWLPEAFCCRPKLILEEEEDGDEEGSPENCFRSTAGGKLDGNGNGKLQLELGLNPWLFLARKRVHGIGTAPDLILLPFAPPTTRVVCAVVAKSRLLNSGNGNANSRTKGAGAQAHRRLLATRRPPAMASSSASIHPANVFEKCKSN